MTLAHLKRLEAKKFEFDPNSTQEKHTALRALKVASLKTAEQVLRLHEQLCFMQAWPDDSQVRSLVDALLANFDRRADLKRHAADLANTGIAGTPIHFRFYAATALWLANRWPDHMKLDWETFENAERLQQYLELLGSFSETPALDSAPLELVEWVQRMKGPQETDAVYIIRRLAARLTDPFFHDQFYEELDLPLILAPGRDTPSRTRTQYPKSPVAYQTAPMLRGRPVVADEMNRACQPPKRVSRPERGRLIDLAHTAMVTRERDLDAFAYADPEDVSLIDDGDNDLQFVIHGMIPERRFLLETLYGFVVLKSGVPISYGSVTCLFNSAEIAYTAFDTFRGGESARIYVRSLAMARHVFGCDTFMVDPYQLGDENEDALRSGAWWFYQKLGYRPRDKTLRRLMNQELAQMKQRPKHRSSMAVLKQLATENVYLHLAGERDDVVGILDLANLGLKITDLLAKRFGSDREAGERQLAAEAAVALGVTSFRGWTAAEQLAWRRWASLVALLPGLDRWPTQDRQDLVQLIRAKGGRQELDYVRGMDQHPRLRKALTRLIQTP